MEDKRLNFNRPLISVRRFSPTVAKSQKEARTKNESSIPALLPSPSLHSGPLRNPGTVPFVWEQTPGRPKNETKQQKPPAVPNLPPGRILKPEKQDFDVRTRGGFYVEKCPLKEISHLRNDNGNDDGKKPQIIYGPNFLQFNDDDNEDDTDSDYDEHGNMSFKFCGLLPQFCLKGSMGILNPTPGFSVRTRLPVSSANRTRVGSAPATSQVAAYEPKSTVKQQRDLPIKSTEDTNQKTSQMLEQAHAITDNHNESEKEVSIHKKGLLSFKELLAYENENEAPIIEKTLYVDTIHKAKENDADIDVFGISHSDLFADTSQHDKDMITCTGRCNDHKVDQKLQISPQTGSELPAPPPLPKSPSDSWLWRTLPSVNSKAASLWSNHKQSSNTTTRLAKNDPSQHPQGVLIPIPEA